MRLGVLLCLLLTGIMAGPETGAIHGTVTGDPDGAVVAGAAVNLWRDNSCTMLHTDSLGHYSADLSPGYYTVIAAASGGRYAGHKVEIQPGMDVCLDLRVARQRPIPRVPVPVSSSAQGLPTRSDSRLDRTDKGWAVVRSSLAIKQVGDSVFVQVKGPVQQDWDRQGISEGIIPFADFRAFWDSLNLLGFWRLKDAYAGPHRGESESGGQLAASCEYLDQATATKTVRYSNPEGCSLEFRRVYHLFQNMARFAQPPKEEEVKATLRRISPSEAMAILDKFPEMIPSDLASKENDTTFLDSLFDFIEVSAAPLELAFPGARFYRCLNTETKPPRFPYLVVVVGDKRSTPPGGFNQLLHDCGLQATNDNVIELAKAFVLIASGYVMVYLDDERGVERFGFVSFPSVVFLDAKRMRIPIEGTSFDTELEVKVGVRVEEWYFKRHLGRFATVLRRTDAGQLVKQYDLPEAESPPER